METTFVYLLLWCTSMIAHAIGVLWMAIKHGKNKMVMIIYIPIFLFLSAFTFYSIEALSGWPTKIKMPGEFQLHWYLINEKKNIYLWINTPGKKSPPMAHIIPYTKQTHKNLQSMKKALMTGKIRILGKKVFGQKTLGQKIPPHHYKFYRFNHQKQFPKVR